MFPHSECCWLHPVVCLAMCFLSCFCCKLVVWSLNLAQIRFLASMLQSRCCVCPLGATYCPVVSPSVTLTAISDHHLDPFIYYQRDANTQLGLQSLVFTVLKRGPRPSTPLSLHSPWIEAGESDNSGPWFQVQVAYEFFFFFPLHSGYSYPFFLSHLVSYIQLFRQKHMALLVWSLVILTSLAVGMNQVI